VNRESGDNPEHDALMADSVGPALLVVLETLAPAERLAFVLHDMFAVPFDEIAPIMDRTPEAARQLASRARRRVQGADVVPNPDLRMQREVVDAFLAASRNGDFDALITLLDPEVVLRADPAAGVRPTAQGVHGAQAVANYALKFSGGARFAQPALVNGAVGIVIAPPARGFLVLSFAIASNKITGIDVIMDHERLPQLNLAVLE
jgi:RNA polymerase sigma-70 factor (ECF subfamily)